MKVSVASSLLILCIGAMIGWRDEQRLATVGAIHHQFVTKAAKFGITLDRSSKQGGVRMTKREREHQTKEAAIKDAAARFTNLAMELSAMRARRDMPGEAMHNTMVGFLEVILSLDSAQLKTFMAEVRANEDLEDDSREEIIHSSMYLLASEYPQAALMLLTESSGLLKDVDRAKKLIFHSISKWAATDPAAALNWFRINGEKFPTFVDYTTKFGLISGTAVNDPKLAFKLMAEIGMKDDESAIWRIVVTPQTSEQCTTTLAALREYLATLPEGEIRTAVSKSSLVCLAQIAEKQGFEAGSKWIESADLTSQQLVEISDLGHSIKLEESGRWVEWMGAKLTGEKSKNSIRSIVCHWTEKDYKAAGKWLAATPAGPTKNISIRSYAEAVAKYEPESAAQWAMTLPPGEDRDETLESIYQKWPANDEVAKEAFKKLHRIK